MAFDRTLSVNKRARFNYEILDTVEAGLVLTGTEIKSVRAGQVSIREAYARPENGEIWLVNAHVAHYVGGNTNNHDPTRARKLLLQKSQIVHLSRQVNQKGLTLVPLKLYIKGHVAKVEIALARGRKHYDKRRALIEKYREREVREATIRKLPHQ